MKRFMILFFVSALLLAFDQATPSQAAPNGERTVAIERTLPPGAVTSLPAVRGRVLDNRFDTMIAYQSTLHDDSMAVRGEFKELDLTPREAVVYIGLLWYDMSSTVNDLVYYSSDWPESDKLVAADFLIESLYTLRDGLVQDMGAMLEDVRFLTDAAEFAESMKMDSESLATLEVVARETESALSKFVSEEFGLPFLDYLDYGFWIADTYTTLDIVNSADTLGLPDDARKQAVSYLSQTAAKAAAFSSAVVDDALVVNAVKRSMSSIIDIVNRDLDDDAVAALTYEIKVIVSAVMGGAFEKERTTG